MKRAYDFFIGCCIALFFLVTYRIMAAINSVKDWREGREKTLHPSVRAVKSPGGAAKN